MYCITVQRRGGKNTNEGVQTYGDAAWAKSKVKATRATRTAKSNNCGVFFWKNRYGVANMVDTMVLKEERVSRLEQRMKLWYHHSSSSFTTPICIFCPPKSRNTKTSGRQQHILYEQIFLM